MILPEERKITGGAQVPSYCDWAFDIKTGRLKTRGGQNYLEYGIPALQTWIYKTLRTQRGQHAIYGDEYGMDIQDVVGKIPDAVLEGVITTALTVSPYILSVDNFELTRGIDFLYVRFTVNTVFGPTRAEVDYGIL